MEWQTKDGMPIDVQSIEYLSDEDKESLKISFDGRYNIDELFVVLNKEIADPEARMGLKLAARIDKVVKSLAKTVINIFSTISGIIAATPLPFADVYILLIIQAIMVALIAIMSGLEVNMDNALQVGKDFILSAGGIVGAGVGFRLVAQQGAKFINALVPVAGSAVSAAVAIGGTKAIGAAAVSYYIDGIDIKTVKKKIKEMKKNNKKDKIDE